ncbi:stage 0 sporulation protein B (sporulation initiation phosphotransferase) [Bacillus ectoiniformans]|nr:stage 0 sporulation protein B (sporulation initiation phosphotransferase) [Bacillus ectoiniformans]
MSEKLGKGIPVRMDMKNDTWTVVQALRHARHDWMNHIQLIKGYISLGKIEEAERAIENIIIQAHQESHLCNLRLPMFAELLLTFNWEARSFNLEYEVFNEEVKAHISDEALTSWCAALFRTLEQYIKLYADNHLYLLVDKTEEGLRFFFEFSGIITDSKTLSQEVEELLRDSLFQRSQMHLISSGELQFEVIASLGS